MIEGLEVTAQHPRILEKATLSDWQKICDANPVYASPLLSPEFALMIGDLRSDTRTITVRADGRLVACLTVHRRKFGFTRPVGAPFDDYAGPVLAAGYQICFRELLKAVGFHSYRANCLLVQPDVNMSEENNLEHHIQCFAIQLQDENPEDYLEDRRTLHPKRFKNFRRLRRKLASEQIET